MGSNPTRAIENYYVSVEQSGVLVCLSRRRSWVQIPSGTLKFGMVRKLEKRRSLKLRDCLRVRLPPVLLLEKHALAGHWRAQVAVTHSPSGCGGSTPSQRTLTNGQVAKLVDARLSESRSFGIASSNLALATC